jgi:hypothetical protein
MLTLCKSTILGAAFLAGVAIAAHADPASTSAAGTVTNGVSGSQSQGRGLAALPPSTATPVPNSVTLPPTKNYQVPSDFDANVNLHPYTSGLGPDERPIMIDWSPRAAVVRRYRDPDLASLEWSTPETPTATFVRRHWQWPATTCASRCT